jgi:hypothetical protein
MANSKHAADCTSPRGKSPENSLELVSHVQSFAEQFETVMLAKVAA